MKRLTRFTVLRINCSLYLAFILVSAGNSQELIGYVKEMQTQSSFMVLCQIDTEGIPFRSF